MIPPSSGALYWKTLQQPGYALATQKTKTRITFPLYEELLQESRAERYAAGLDCDAWALGVARIEPFTRECRCLLLQDCGGHHVSVISQHSPAALGFLQAQVETLAGFLESEQRRPQQYNGRQVLR